MPGAISLPPELVLPHLLPAFEELAKAWLREQPTPDQQYTIEQTAGLMSVSSDTIGDYLRLPASHPRRLEYVVTHDSHKGRRICLSAIRAWQQRNHCDMLAAAEQAESQSRAAQTKRRARRRPLQRPDSAA